MFETIFFPLNKSVAFQNCPCSLKMQFYICIVLLQKLGYLSMMGNVFGNSNAIQIPLKSLEFEVVFKPVWVGILKQLQGPVTSGTAVA